MDAERSFAPILMEISISKDVLPSLEGYGFIETILGDRRGSTKQYRNSSGLHIREYHDKFVVHEDKVDPRVDPIGHLMKDSPETLIAFGAAFLLSQNKRCSSSTQSKYSSFNPMVFVFSLLSLNKLLGILKKLL
ncbi:MAG: hypothetical protein ACYCPW_03360 [Nitrososphaerales archaeon]